MSSPTHHIHSIDHLLVILLVSIVDDVEESELVDTLGGRDDTEPVSELLLLEELLCPIPTMLASVLCDKKEIGCSQVLEVSARELSVGDNFDLSITNLLDLNNVTEVSYTAIDLDFILEELLECGNVEDLVGSGLRSIDNELIIISKITPFEIAAGLDGGLESLPSW